LLQLLQYKKNKQTTNSYLLTKNLNLSAIEWNLVQPLPQITSRFGVNKIRTIQKTGFY